MAARIIDELIQFHARVVGTSINEPNAEVAIRSGLDDVTAIDQITDLGLANAICGQISFNCNCG